MAYPKHIEPIVAKFYEIEVRNDDNTRSTLKAKYVGQNTWEFGIGHQTRRGLRVLRRLYWYTDQWSNIIAGISVLISLIALGVSLFK